MLEDKNARVNEEHDTAEAGEIAGSDTELSDETEADTAAEVESGVEQEQKSENQVQELQDKLLRAAAEFDNYKKRVARQYDETIQSANDRILLDLVEIADNFDRALQHSENNSPADSLRKGVELIHTQLAQLLEKYSVKPIEALGKPFDPNLHDALMQVESEEYDDGIVALEMSKGYLRGERVLRHSKVGVSKGKE
ncbi:MAG TPA: nucleotide exchange factor GrpE [candidate division Zixibacteria bacterium]|nr:nucleotide exchange factor GrpE [candidate division Zixibacteria bacterium]